MICGNSPAYPARCAARGKAAMEYGVIPFIAPQIPQTRRQRDLGFHLGSDPQKVEEPRCLHKFSFTVIPVFGGKIVLAPQFFLPDFIKTGGGP